MFSSDVPEEAAPDSQHADINAAVFFLIISKYMSSVIFNLLVFSICNNSPSLISLTALLTIFNKPNSSFSTANNKPLDSKKSPTNTETLFFQRAFIENTPRLKFASSITSSCTNVAVCRSSIKLAAV